MSWRRFSAAVTRTRRWKALRLQALRRDGWKCVKCGKPGREVDHVLPVRTHPELAFALSNLQTLDGRCHSRKTRIEVGLGAEPDPRREAWQSFANELAAPSLSERNRNARICENRPPAV